MSEPQRTGAYREDGVPVTLVGVPVALGDAAPDFIGARWNGETLQDVTLAATGSGWRLLTTLPSLDTPVCSVQARRFASELAALAHRVTLVTVSTDTPWRQHGFATENGLAAGLMISDAHHRRSFGRAYGLLVEETGELRRAAYLVDPSGTIVYAQEAADGGDHLDYEAVLTAISEALAVAGARPSAG